MSKKTTDTEAKNVGKNEQKLEGLFGPGSKPVEGWAEDEDFAGFGDDDTLDVPNNAEMYSDAEEPVSEDPEDFTPYRLMPRTFVSNFNDVRGKGGTLAYRYAERLKEELKEYEGLDRAVGAIHIDAIDRLNSNIPDAGILAYSCVVASMVLDTTLFSYILVIQDSSVKEVLSFEEYNKRRVANANSSTMNYYGNFTAAPAGLEYTPDRCVDSVYYGVVSRHLKAIYPQVTNEITAAAAVIYNDKNVTDKVIESTCREVAKIVYNVIRNMVNKEIAPDAINLTLPSHNNPSYNLSNGSNFILGSAANRESGKYTMTNLNGMPVRADFTVTLDFVEKQEKRSSYYGNIGYDNNYTPFNQVSSMNTGDQVRKLTTIHGYVDPVVVRLNGFKDQRVNDKMIKRAYDIIPNVVLTSINTDSTTLGYVMLAIISAFGVVNNDKLIGVLNIHSKRNNVGALNVYCDLYNESAQSGLLKPLSLYPKGQKNATSEDYAAAYTTAQLLFNANVVLSVDVPVAGFDSAYLSPISAASAVPGKVLLDGMAIIRSDDVNFSKLNASAMLSVNAAISACEIIKTVNALTNGKFPLTFPIDEIFVGPHILIPNGYYMDKSEARDIREIDLPFVINESNLDVATINNWSLCSSGCQVGKLPAYDVKAEIISRLVGHAQFTGLSARCTFSNKFLATLFEAVVSNGFNPVDTSTIKVPVSNLSYITNGGVTTGYYDKAGIDFGGISFYTQGNGLTTTNNGFSTAGLWAPGMAGANWVTPVR